MHAAWLNPKANLLFFVVRREDPVKWGRGKIVVDRLWHLFVLHHDAEAGLLHVNSSDKESVHEDLARAVGVPRILPGEAKTTGSAMSLRSLGGRHVKVPTFNVKKVADQRPTAAPLMDQSIHRAQNYRGHEMSGRSPAHLTDLTTLSPDVVSTWWLHVTAKGVTRQGRQQHVPAKEIRRQSSRMQSITIRVSHH